MTDGASAPSGAGDRALDDAVLDNPVLAALTGPQAGLARSRGRAVRYLPGVAPFGALPAHPTAQDWADLAGLVDPGDAVALLDPPAPPDGWVVARTFEAVQMVTGSADRAEPRAVPAPTAPTAPDVVELGPDDVAHALDLVARTQPGPFGPRTMELGRYLAVRDSAGLAAMAGERMRVPGWTEVSAVCTDPAHRGRGLAALLVEAVVAGIAERGDRAFLHVMRANEGAQRIYRAHGFTVRRELTIRALQPPH